MQFQIISYCLNLDLGHLDRGGDRLDGISAGNSQIQRADIIRSVVPRLLGAIYRLRGNGRPVSCQYHLGCKRSRVVNNPLDSHVLELCYCFTVERTGNNRGGVSVHNAHKVIEQMVGRDGLTVDLCREPNLKGMRPVFLCRDRIGLLSAGHVDHLRGLFHAIQFVVHRLGGVAGGNVGVGDSTGIRNGRIESGGQRQSHHRNGKVKASPVSVCVHNNQLNCVCTDRKEIAHVNCDIALGNVLRLFGNTAYLDGQSAIAGSHTIFNRGPVRGKGTRRTVRNRLGQPAGSVGEGKHRIVTGAATATASACRHNNALTDNLTSGGKIEFSIFLVEEKVIALEGNSSVKQGKLLVNVVGGVFCFKTRRFCSGRIRRGGVVCRFDRRNRLFNPFSGVLKRIGGALGGGCCVLGSLGCLVGSIGSFLHSRGSVGNVSKQGYQQIVIVVLGDVLTGIRCRIHFDFEIHSGQLTSGRINNADVADNDVIQRQHPRSNGDGNGTVPIYAACITL